MIAGWRLETAGAKTREKYVLCLQVMPVIELAIEVVILFAT